MSATNETRTIEVAPGARITAELPRTGVLRLQRMRGAMTGTPEMVGNEGVLSLFYADGAEITLRT